MRSRFRAVVEYDGSRYCGFQRQKGQPTIQAELETAIGLLGGEDVSITGAGRTDSGVHASGQVIAFDLNWAHGPIALHKAINANLPTEIALVNVETVDKSFHPRFDARRRLYEYCVFNSEVRSPLLDRRSWHVRQRLEIWRMNSVAETIIGEHDFATFGRPPVGENTVRTVYRAGWRLEHKLLVFAIEANAFLYRMVRSLVGSMVLVGSGAWTKEGFEAAFRSRDRSRAGKTAPAQGLTLVSVLYE